MPSQTGKRYVVNMEQGYMQRFVGDAQKFADQAPAIKTPSAQSMIVADPQAFASDVARGLTGSLAGLQAVLVRIRELPETVDISDLRDLCLTMSMSMTSLSRAMTEQYDALNTVFDEHDSPLIVQPLLQAVAESWVLLLSLQTCENIDIIPVISEASMHRLQSPECQAWLDRHLPAEA